MNIPVIHKYIDIQKLVKQNLILAPTGHLAVSRDRMPQIDNQYREAFIEYMKAQGIKVRKIRVPARSLKMVQGEYNRDKVASIIDSGNAEGQPIFISRDGYVIDGNHRLIAKLNMPTKSKYIEAIELGMDALPLLGVIHAFPHVRYRNINDTQKTGV